MSKYTQQLAKAIGLTNWKTYTSHSIRRSGATYLANHNLNPLLLRKAGRWSTEKTCSIYIDNCMATKKNIADTFKEKDVKKIDPIEVAKVEKIDKIEKNTISKEEDVEKNQKKSVTIAKVDPITLNVEKNDKIEKITISKEEDVEKNQKKSVTFTINF
jgi:hypothetical protein